MKKKLPEEKSSYKNLYSGEIRETENFLNSWAKCSLIGLLIRKFFNDKNFINSFDFRIVPLSRDSSYSRNNNKILILNTLMLFALPVSIFIYRSTSISIVEQNNFDLTEFQKRAHRGKDYNMRIYIKYFRGLIKNFDIFSRNFCILGDIEKTSKNDFLIDIIPVFYEGLLEVDNLFERQKYDSIYGLDFHKKFLDFFISTKGIKNRDCFRLRKRIIQNLRSWGESDEIMVKSFSLLKKKGNLDLSSYTKFHSLQLSRDRIYNLDRAKQKKFTEGTSKYFDSKLNNSKFFLTLEKIISDSIYQFSRFLSYEAGKSDNRIIKTNLLTKELDSNKKLIDLDYTYIDKEIEKNLEFIDCINPNQLHNWNTYKYYFGWIKKFMCVGNRALVKPLFLDPIPLTKSLYFSKKKQGSYLYFLGRYPTNSNDKYIINNLFSQRGIETVNTKKSVWYVFPEPLLIDRFNQNIFNTDFNKISKNMGRIHYLKKNIESDDIGIISWRIHKYHSNFLLNHSLPFNVAYNMIRQNHSMSKEIPSIFWRRWNQLFLEIFHLLLLISSEFKNIFLFINRTELKKHLIERDKELDLLLSESNEIKDANFSNKFILLPILNQDNESCNKKTESINYYLLIINFIQTKLSAYNSVRYNYNKYFEKLLNNSYLREELLLDSKKIYRKYKIHEYSKFCREIVRKNFLCNIGDIEYNKLTLQVYKWIDVMNTLEISDFSEEIVLDPFFINIEFSEIFEIFSQNPNSKDILKYLLNYLQIMANTSNINDVRNNLLFNKSDNSINSNLVITSNSNKRYIDELVNNSLVTGMNHEVYIDLLSESFSLKNISFDSTINRKLSCTSYNERFIFHWKKIGIENNIVYLQFLKNFYKYNGFSPIIFRIKFFSLRKKIVWLAQLQLTNALLWKGSYESSDKTEWVYFSSFYRELSSQNNLYLPARSNIVCSKQEIDQIGTVSYYKFLMENLFIKIDSERIVKNFLVPQLNDIEIQNHYNLLRSESLIEREDINSDLFQSINNVFLYPKSKYFEKDLKYGVRNKILKDTDEFYKYDQSEIFSFFARYISFMDFDYTLWFFTSEWWQYHIHIFVQTFRKFFLVIGYHLEYFVDDHIGVTQKNLVSLWKRGKNFYNLNLKWNSRVFSDYDEEISSNSVWSDFQLINNWNNSHWIVLSSIILISFLYQNNFSILIGSDSIDLWKYFETIKYLTDTSRAFYFTKLMHRNETQPNKTENLVSYFFSSSKYYLKNIRFYLLTKKNLSKWLIRNKSLDLSRRKRNLLVQSLITHTRIKEYGFQLYPKQKLVNNELGYQVNNQQGLSYLQYLVEIFKKNLVNYPLYLADKWIFFASLQKIIYFQTLRQAERFNPRFQKIPIPLQFGLSCSKGILLIGSIETGRSYLIKNLAADSYAPLFRISINKLLYNKPDVITESWMNILIESLRRLNLTLDFAKGMSPCMIWMQNIHQLDVNRSTQNIESDPTFLLGILLKHFQTESTKTRTGNDIIIIGSTHVPKKVDPSLISPDRLDGIINIRLFDTSRRKKLFPILLNRNNLQLKKNLLRFNDFGSRTMGYNMRDLATLTNEISLISLTKNESFIYTDIIKLAFHRQVLGFTHTNNKSSFRRNFKILLYKIGKTIIQNILVEGSATNPLNISNYLWKKKFYYLSKWYSEPPGDESIVKESTILVHVLGCLAGIAARDSWFLSEKYYDIWIPLDKSVENDLDLASSILESFSIEFPRLETCKTQFIDYGHFPKMNSLSIMQNGIFAIANRSIGHTRNDSEYKLLVSRQKFIDRKSCEFKKKTVWSPRFWRLSFSRSHLFDWIKRPNDFEFFHKFKILKNDRLEKRNHYDQIMDGGKEQLLYERILPRVRKRNVQELEYQFEHILLEEQFEILGFFRPSAQYRMEQFGNKPRLFIGKRILWDPTGSFPQIRHSVFSRREFFVDEEMLRRLYITYGVRREREQSFSNHRIKRFFICRGYNKDLINKLSVRWWNPLPIDQKQNIYMLKRIEKIGIRLKRPQIFTPVYLYQRWLIENIPEKYSRLKLLTHQDRWLKTKNLLLNDSSTYTTLLESYQYLFEFFLSNKVLLNRMTKMLLRKKWLFQNEIEDIIRT